jgi:hypothetical protein
LKKTREVMDYAERTESYAADAADLAEEAAIEAASASHYAQNAFWNSFGTKCDNCP